MPDLLLIGASGLAREVMAVLRDAGDPREIALLDDDPARWGQSIDGRPVLGGLDLVVDHPLARLLLCAGHGQARARLADRLETLGVTTGRYGTVVHGSVTVPESCTVGEGSIVLAGVVLTTAVILGRHAVVMPHVTLTHDDRIGSCVTLCAGVTLGGHVRIGAEAYLGMNSAVRQNVTVGPRSTIGMGAAVLTDVPADQTWFGVPAARQPERVIA